MIGKLLRQRRRKEHFRMCYCREIIVWGDSFTLLHIWSDHTMLPLFSFLKQHTQSCSIPYITLVQHVNRPFSFIPQVINLEKTSISISWCTQAFFLKSSQQLDWSLLFYFNITTFINASLQMVSRNAVKCSHRSVIKSVSFSSIHSSMTSKSIDATFG